MSDCIKVLCVSLHMLSFYLLHFYCFIHFSNCLKLQIILLIIIIWLHFILLFFQFILIVVMLIKKISSFFHIINIYICINSICINWNICICNITKTFCFVWIFMHMNLGWIIFCGEAKNFKIHHWNSRKILVYRFQSFRFSDSMVISKNKYIMIKSNIKNLPNFTEIITYLRRKITHFKKYQSQEKFIFWQLVRNFADFRWNNIGIHANKIIIIKWSILKY